MFAMALEMNIWRQSHNGAIVRWKNVLWAVWMGVQAKAVSHLPTAHGHHSNQIPNVHGPEFAPRALRMWINRSSKAVFLHCK